MRMTFNVQKRVHEVVREAVDLEEEFCCKALSVALVGMNAALMSQYIQFVADRLLVRLTRPQAPPAGVGHA